MPISGPLRVHSTNPRWFSDAGGRAVYLTGSHHWDTLQDNGERPGAFDFPAHLDALAAWGHTFIRLWAHEAWTHEVRPLPFARTGPGTALDGGPRFDLTRFDPAYFARLRNRVAAAGTRGFYVSVMLWNGWSIHDKGEGNPWPRHPMHRANNVNGIDGDPAGRGDGRAVHTLAVPAVTRFQEAYAGRVVATVGDLPNVLWEIANESPGESRDWQHHMVRHLKALEGAGRMRHPVGMTFAWPGGTNADLFASPADWISPGRRGGWMTSPPPADGMKVVLLDTDHLWGLGGDRAWVWKSFLRGHHPIFMDPLDDDPAREAARRAMGATAAVARGLDLATAAPEPRLASTGYCLAGPEELLAYLPPRRLRRSVRLDLSTLPGELAVEWIDPGTGAATPGGRIEGGGRRRLAPPWRGDAALRVARVRDDLD